MSRQPPRVYYPAPLQHKQELDPAQAHHLINVLRLQPGDAITLFNQVDGEVKALIRKERSCYLAELVAGAAAARAAGDGHGGGSVSPRGGVVRSLCFVPVKPANSGLIAEKATELGVDFIQPLISERCTSRHLSSEKLRKITIAASEQCGRISVPHIPELSSLEEHFKGLKAAASAGNGGVGLEAEMAHHCIMVFDTAAAGVFYKDKGKGDDYRLEVLSAGAVWPWVDRHLRCRRHSAGSAVQLLAYVGPEGGWSQADRAVFMDFIGANSSWISGAVVAIGDYTMRSETAAIVAAAILNMINLD